MPPSRSQRIDLLRSVDLIHKHITDAPCCDIYRRHRVLERERIWTLARLAEFWSQVALRSPTSLTQMLQDPLPSNSGDVQSPPPKGHLVQRWLSPEESLRFAAANNRYREFKRLPRAWECESITLLEDPERSKSGRRTELRGAIYHVRSAE